MIKSRIYLLAQVVNVMDEAVNRMEEALKNRDVGEFEKSKKILLEFQKRLSEELLKVKK